MNCFYHSTSPAVTLCKSCLRGLCVECSVDIDDGFACLNRCEDRARRINKMVDANSRIMANANTQLRRNMIFGVVAGLLFIGFAFTIGWPDQWLTGTIFGALGLAFIFRGISSYSRAARYPTPDQHP